MEQLTATIFVKVKPSQRAALESIAEERDLTMSDIAREAIKRYIESCTEQGYEQKPTYHVVGEPKRRFN